jgi:hypothetical protein
MEPECSLPTSEQPGNGPYSELHDRLNVDLKRTKCTGVIRKKKRKKKKKKIKILFKRNLRTASLDVRVSLSLSLSLSRLYP